MAEPVEEKPFVFTPANGAEATIKGFTGKAKAEFSNGDVYEGDYVDGKKQGKGLYEYLTKTETVPNNDTYKGQFQNNQRHGIGILTHYLGEDKKEEYYGEWKNDKKGGEGRYTYVNGDVYSGEWQNGRKHGEGTYIFAKTQMKLKGEFHENKLLRGQWIYPNGTIFEGKFENQKPINEGVWSFSNGNKVYGDYVQTKVPLKEDEKNRKALNVKLEWVTKQEQQYV